MTVNPSRTDELSINELVKSAYVMAGSLHFSQPLDNARGAWGRTLLETITKNLETMGIQVRARDFLNLQLTAGVDRYSLDADVLDVIGDAKYIAASETDVDHASNETLVQLIDASAWQSLSTKSAQGNPTLLYAHRAAAQVEARFWTTPVEAGTVRLMVQRLYPNSSDGNATPGLERVWAQYFIHELGGQIAESQSKADRKIARLFGKAAKLLEQCQGFANQRTGTQFYVDHAQGR